MSDITTLRDALHHSYRQIMRNGFDLPCSERLGQRAQGFQFARAGRTGREMSICIGAGSRIQRLVQI